MAKLGLAGFCIAKEIIAEVIVIPADGPSLGVAPKN
jgi:hypothetical protein